GGSVEGRAWMGRAHPTAAPHFAERPDQIAVPLLLALPGLATLEERCGGVDC
ncbi:trans-sialidase, putative, partial [Trypanosoma cruzi]